MAGPAGGAVEPEVTGGGRGRRPGAATAAIAGGLTLVYVLGSVLDLILLGFDPTAFNRVHRDLDTIAPRVVLAVVGFAVVFHAADGVGRAAIDLRPALDRHRAGILAAGRFVALATAVPMAAAIAWPAVRAWWVR